MTRLTRKPSQEENYYIEETNLTKDDLGYSGDAVERLANFENFYEDLVASQERISKELTALRSEGKEKSVKFRELLGNKLMNTNMLVLMKQYGLE